MTKTVKLVAFVAGGVLALLVIALGALTLFFDPDNYRDEIVKAVKDATGRELKIEGKLGWTLVPRLGISVERIELANAPGFGREPFARIEAAGVDVEWLPLLTGRVRVDTFYLDGLTLNLASNAAGQTNWGDLVAGDRTAAKPEPATATAKKDTPSPDAFAARRLKVRDTTLTWRDQASSAAYAVRGLNVDAGPLALGKPMNVKLGLDLEYGEATGESARRVPVNLQTSLTADTERLALDKLALTIGESRLTGSAEIINLSNPAVRFNLALDQFDLDPYLPQAADTKPVPSKNGAVSPSADLPLPLLRTLDVKGEFAVGKFKAFGLRTEDIQLNLAAKGGMLRLGPNRAKLYGGNYQGNLSLDARTSTPKIEADQQLTAVQLGPLLKDAALFDKFSGTAEIKLALRAQGADVNALKRTLNGKVAVAARDGKIEGVNFEKLIAQARQLADQLRNKEVSVTPASSDETAFQSLRANFTLTDGVAATNDFTLDGPVLRGTGGGSANLVTEALDARLKITVAEAAGRKGRTVPLKIGGTLTAPSFGVDAGEFVKEEITKKLDKDKLEQKLEQKLEKLFKKR